MISNWQQILATAPFGPRTLFRGLSARGYMWVCGGYDNVATKHNDVWRSTDGITWEQVTAGASWSTRSGHGFILYNNRFYVFGGNNQAGTFLNDVWRSDDCVTWTQLPDAPWGIRHEFAYCEHNGEVYISGGFEGVYRLHDVWKTADFTTWTQTTGLDDPSTLPPDSIRARVREHTMVSYLGRLWIHGGDGADYDGDPEVLLRIQKSSLDGTTWDTHALAVWSGRREHQAVISVDDELVIIGGYGWDEGWNLTAYNDVWKSTNGIDWEAVDQEVSFPIRSDYVLINHLGYIYIIGGVSGTEVYSDVYRVKFDIKLYALQFTGIPEEGIAPMAVRFNHQLVDLS